MSHHMYKTYFAYPFISCGTCGLFHIWVIINNAGINTCVQVFVRVYVFISFSHKPRSGIGGSLSFIYEQRENLWGAEEEDNLYSLCWNHWQCHMRVHSFPIAAATNYYKFASLKQCIFLKMYCCGGLKSKVSQQSWFPTGDSRGTSFLDFPSFLRAPAIPSLVSPSFIPPSPKFLSSQLFFWLSCLLPIIILVMTLWMPE